jgi:hypothetical protein
MPHYDYLSIVKRQAKGLAKSQSIKLTLAQQRLATQAGFQHYHELQAVAGSNPNDSRLMKAALGTNDLDGVIYDDLIYEELDSLVEDQMAGAIAETNAVGFTIEDYESESANYDPQTGFLTIIASLSYSGEKDPEKVFSGSEFFLEVQIRLFRSMHQWEFANKDELVIISSKSDQDLDWAQQEVEGKLI